MFTNYACICLALVLTKSFYEALWGTSYLVRVAKIGHHERYDIRIIISGVTPIMDVELTISL